MSGIVVYYFSHLILGLNFKSLAGPHFSPAPLNKLAIRQILYPRVRCPLSYSPDIFFNPFLTSAMRGVELRAIMPNFARLPDRILFWLPLRSQSVPNTPALLAQAVGSLLPEDFFLRLLKRELSHRLASLFLPAKWPII